MDSVWYQIIPRRSPWNYELPLNRLCIKWHKLFSTFREFINIIRQSAPCSFYSCNFWKNWYKLFVWTFFSITQWTFVTYSQHISAVLPRETFTKIKHKYDHHLQVILRFSLLHISMLVYRRYFTLCWDKYCFNVLFN